MTRTFAAALVASLLLAPSLAAADAPRIRLSLHRCLHLQEDKVQALVGVELKGNVSAPTAAVEGRVSVEVRCVKGGALVEVFDEEGALVASRTVRLAAYGASSRPRLLAMTIAEMVDAVWDTPPSEPGPGPAPSLSVPGAPEPSSLPGFLAATPSDPAADGARPAGEVHAGLDVELPKAPKKAPQERLYDLSVRVTTRKFAQGPFEFGGSLRGAVAFTRFLVAEADFCLERGEAATELGNVSGTTYSLAAWTGIRLDLEPVELRGGVGLRGGVASLTGSPGPGVKAGAVTGGWAGPMVALGVRWLVSDVILEVGGDAGVNLTPVRGLVAGGNEVSIAGGWFGVQLGVGYRL